MSNKENKYIVVTHMILGSKCCATNAYLCNTLNESKDKAFEIIKKEYQQYCEDEGEEIDKNFEIIEPTEEHYDIFMECIEKYTGNKGYGPVVTITEV
jgi:hypothetical protein